MIITNYFMIDAVLFSSSNFDLLSNRFLICKKYLQAILLMFRDIMTKSNPNFSFLF